MPVNAERDTAYLDVLRWLAMLAVVALHTVSAETAAPFPAIHDGLLFCVPIFAMVTGALFLAPGRTLTYPLVLKKYVRRIALALLVFGAPLAALELVFDGGFNLSVLPRALLAVYSDGGWSHMWYLYMLIGLYLLLPLFKRFTDQAPPAEKGWLIAILFVFTSLKPLIEAWTGAPCGFYLPISTVYPLYLLLGHCLHECEPRGQWWSHPAVLLLGVAVGFLPATGLLPGPTHYDSPFLVVQAACLFALAKKYRWRAKWLTRARPLCFCVYLVHPLFINVAYRLLRLSPAAFYPALSVPLFTLAFLAVSLACSYLLCKIPLLRKYVL